jgi:PAS domain S-box-containing protein
MSRTQPSRIKAEKFTPTQPRAMLEALIEGTKHAIWYLDTDYRFLEGNTAFMDLYLNCFGQLPEKGTALYCEAWEQFPQLGCFEDYENVFNGNGATRSKTVKLATTGTIYKLEFLPITDTNPTQVHGVCVQLRDITDRIRSRQELEESKKQLLEAQVIGGIGNWNWDLENNEISWSDPLFKIFGLHPDEFDGTYESLVRYIHPEEKEAFHDDIKRSIREKSDHDIVLRILTHSGEIKYVHQKGKAFYDDNGWAYRMAGTTQDVTQTVLANQKIALQNKELQHFVHVVSHNLRSPISNILMLPQVYTRGQQPANDAIVDQMIYMTKRLDRTIKDLNHTLELKKVNTADFRMVSLHKVMLEVKKLLADDLKKHNVQLSSDFSLASDIPCYQGYMVNILYNLILNGIRYKQFGQSPKIHVSSDKREGKRIVSVSDNGIGIALTPERRKKIFEMYGKLSGKTKGKGLGLYLVKAQVEALEGTIDVTSTPGMGTTFTMEFNTL